MISFNVQKARDGVVRPLRLDEFTDCNTERIHIKQGDATNVSLIKLLWIRRQWIVLMIMIQSMN